MVTLWCTLRRSPVIPLFICTGAGSSWRFPLEDAGKRFSNIRVVEGKGTAKFFSAGIFSNSPSGFPGKAIASGYGRASTSCGAVTIQIAPTKLKRHTTYWVEEWVSASAVRAGSAADRRKFRPSPYSSFSNSAKVDWFANPTTKRAAYVQRYKKSCFWSSSAHKYRCSSSTSPWTKQTTGPYLKLW